VSFRPLTDIWILARPKVRYFGAYPAGFLLKARDLLNCGRMDQVVHVCSGKVRDYRCGPACKGQTDRHFHGLGTYDYTVDLDPAVEPNLVSDVRTALTWRNIARDCPQVQGVMADPPYLKEFAVNYAVGADVLPTTDSIVKNSIGILPIGGRVGILSMHWPRYPKEQARQIALVGVVVGNGNIGRYYAVYERTA
jgi:hypothetical protein